MAGSLNPNGNGFCVYPSCSSCSCGGAFYPVISNVFSFLSFTLNFPLHFFLKLRLRLSLLELWRLFFFFLRSLLRDSEGDLPLNFAAFFPLYIFYFGILWQNVLASHINSSLINNYIFTQICSFPSPWVVLQFHWYLFPAKVPMILSFIHFNLLFNSYSCIFSILKINESIAICLVKASFSYNCINISIFAKQISQLSFQFLQVSLYY